MLFCFILYFCFCISRISFTVLVLATARGCWACRRVGVGVAICLCFCFNGIWYAIFVVVVITRCVYVMSVEFSTLSVQSLSVWQFVCLRSISLRHSAGGVYQATAKPPFTHTYSLHPERKPFQFYLTHFRIRSSCQFPCSLIFMASHLFVHRPSPFFCLSTSHCQTAVGFISSLPIITIALKGRGRIAKECGRVSGMWAFCTTS